MGVVLIVRSVNNEEKRKFYKSNLIQNLFWLLEYSKEDLLKLALSELDKKRKKGKII